MGGGESSEMERERESVCVRIPAAVAVGHPSNYASGRPILLPLLHLLLLVVHLLLKRLKELHFCSIPTM